MDVVNFASHHHDTIDPMILESLMLLNSIINWLPGWRFSFMFARLLSNRYYRATFSWTLELENEAGTVKWCPLAVLFSWFIFTLLVLIITDLHINLMPASTYRSQKFDENCRLFRHVGFKELSLHLNFPLHVSSRLCRST